MSSLRLAMRASTEDKAAMRLAKRKSSELPRSGGSSLRRAILDSMPPTPAPRPITRPKRELTAEWRGASPTECQTMTNEVEPAFVRGIRGLLSADEAQDLVNLVVEVQACAGFQAELDRSNDRSKTAALESISSATTIKLDAVLFQGWAKRNKEITPFVKRVKDLTKRVTARLSANEQVRSAHRLAFPWAATPKWTTMHLLIFAPGAAPQLPHADDWLSRVLVVNAYLQDGVASTEVIPNMPSKRSFKRCQLSAYKQLLRPGSLNDQFQPALENVRAGDGIAMPGTQVHRGPGNSSADQHRIVLFCADSPARRAAQQYNPKFQLHALLLADLYGKCCHATGEDPTVQIRPASGTSVRLAIQKSVKEAEAEAADNSEEEGGDDKLLIKRVKKAYARKGFILEDHE